MTDPNRRDFLKTTVAFAGIPLIASPSAAGPVIEPPKRPNRYRPADVQALLPKPGKTNVMARIHTDYLDDQDQVVLIDGLRLCEFHELARVVTPSPELGNHGWEILGKCLWISQSEKSLTVGLVLTEVPYFLACENQLDVALGFRSHESSPPTPDECRRFENYGVPKAIHRRWELLELILVPIEED